MGGMHKAFLSSDEKRTENYAWELAEASGQSMPTG
jgi:hypothetical protein